MGTYAEPADVGNIWRTLTGEESAKAATRIEQAESLLARRVRRATGRTLADLITAGSVSVSDVRDLVAEMVFRVMSIPALVRQQSVTVDDGTKSTTYDSSVSGRTGVYVTDEEITDLVGTVKRGRAFTITPGPGPSWT